MRSLFAAAVAIVLLAGCTATRPQAVPAPNVKAFEEEDAFILQALYLEQKGAFAAAAELFGELYARSGKPEYFIRHMGALLHVKAYADVVKRCDEALAENPQWYDAWRLKISALMGLASYESARDEALALVEKTRSTDDYVRVSEAYIRLQRYEMAVKYFEKAYAINYDENILDKMSIVLFVNLKRQKEAIAYLESHSRMHGCSKVICSRLAGFYSEQNNIDGMLSVSLRMFDTFEDPAVADAIVKIYLYKKDYPALITFLEKSGSNDDLLLQMYASNKAYKKAYALATRLYEEKGGHLYLGNSAIFGYESAEDKNDPAMLHRVMGQLKEAIAVEKTPLLLNYLGYLMIDHGLGVEEGIGYVKEALAFEPESVFYLDSLAWGYYKLGKCQEALTILTRVTGELGCTDKEVIEHLEAVKICLEGKKSK